jgi:hypothetical protein
MTAVAFPPTDPPGTVAAYSLLAADGTPGAGAAVLGKFPLTPTPGVVPQVILSTAAGPTVDDATACGLLTRAILVAGSACRWLPSGPLSLTTNQWDLVVTGEIGGLTPGDWYYVSDVTPGFLQNTPPTVPAHFVAPVGVAISPTTLLIMPNYPTVVP